VQEHTAHSVEWWIEDLNHLVSFALMQLHVSYSAFTHGFSSKWTFFLCTTPGIANCFLPLKQVIHHHFLPRLVPHPPNDVERTLFALFAYLGGLGIFNPCEIAPATFQFSRQMTGPIIQCILQQSSFLPHYILDLQQTIFRDCIFDAAKFIHHQCPSDLQHIIVACNGLPPG